MSHGYADMAKDGPRRRGEDSRATALMKIIFHPGPPIFFEYVNHKGERATRHALPVALLFGTSEYYKEPQWLLECWDQDKDAKRHFALSKIENVRDSR